MTMPLSWDVSKVENNDEVCWLHHDTEMRSMNPRTEVLIFATMIIGINQITDANAAEFYRRIRGYELIKGALMVSPKGTPMPTTVADIVAHIGLKTNASIFTATTYNSRLGRWLKDVTDEERAAYKEVALAAQEVAEVTGA